MVAQTDSNDSADLFWPGYVDAVTNLAINLLFVIAVMSIVVIGTTLQISKMINKTGVTDAHEVDVKTSPPAVDQASQEQVVKLRQALADANQQLQQAQRELQQARLQTAPGPHSEIVQAMQNKLFEPKSPNRIQPLERAGVVVAFSPDVVTLSPAETADLIARIKNITPQSGGRWEVSVISPKGLSESVRVAYYRVNAVRNALLADGVSSQSIQIRIHESTQSEADNSKVLVRSLP